MIDLETSLSPRPRQGFGLAPTGLPVLALLFCAACSSAPGGSDAGESDAGQSMDGGNTVVLSGDTYLLLGPHCDSCWPSAATIPDAGLVDCGRVTDLPDSGESSAARGCVAQAEDAGQGWFVTQLTWGYEDQRLRLLYGAGGELHFQNRWDDWYYPHPTCRTVLAEETCSTASLTPITCEAMMPRQTRTVCDERDTVEDGGSHPIEELDCDDAGTLCLRNGVGGNAFQWGHFGPPTYRPITCSFSTSYRDNYQVLYCEQG